MITDFLVEMLMVMVGLQISLIVYLWRMHLKLHDGIAEDIKNGREKYATRKSVDIAFSKIDEHDSQILEVSTRLSKIEGKIGTV